MWHTDVYHITGTASIDGGTPVMETFYRRPATSASICKDGDAPYSTPVTGDTRPYPSHGRKKLLDRFRDKMRALHYALSNLFLAKPLCANMTETLAPLFITV